MNGFTHASGWWGHGLIRRRLGKAGGVARLIIMTLCLVALPAELRLDTDFGPLRIGATPAMADVFGKGDDNGNGGGNSGGNGGKGDDNGNRGGNGGNGGGNSGANERSSRQDRDADRDSNRGNARNERSQRDDRPPSTRGSETSRSAAAAAIGRALADQTDGPGNAPTEAGAARVRAMVEIAKEIGANVPDRTDHVPVSGPVTQEMLDRAEEAYVAAVREAWEAHGFPWTDSDVLRTLMELDALVSSLESIMQAAVADPAGRAGTAIAPDINNDGFVDINDLWDAHRR